MGDRTVCSRSARSLKAKPCIGSPEMAHCGVVLSVSVDLRALVLSIHPIGHGVARSPVSGPSCDGTAFYGNGVLDPERDIVGEKSAGGCSEHRVTATYLRVVLPDDV